MLLALVEITSCASLKKTYLYAEVALFVVSIVAAQLIWCSSFGPIISILELIKHYLGLLDFSRGSVPLILSTL